MTSQCIHNTAQDARHGILMSRVYIYVSESTEARSVEYMQSIELSDITQDDCNV